MKKVSIPHLINLIRSKNPNIKFPEVISLLKYDKIINNFYQKSGEEIFFDFEKIKNLTDLDIIDMIPNDKLSNIIYSTLYNSQNNSIRKSYDIMPIDLINKSLPKMVNNNISLNNIKYSITVEKKFVNVKFSYSHLVVLRAIYNLYSKGILEFTVNDIFYQMYHCQRKNINISKKAKNEIIESIRYMMAIKINIEYKNYNFMINDQLLLIHVKTNNNKITYFLEKEPCLLTLSKEINQCITMPIQAKYGGQRKLIDISIFTCLFDFIFGFSRSPRPTMKYNFSTIFDECNINISSRNKKHDLIIKINRFIECLRCTNLFAFYKTDNETIQIYKKRKENKTIYPLLREALPLMQDVLNQKNIVENQELLESLPF